MYCVVKTRVTQNKKKLFGKVTPFYEKEVNGHAIVIGGFDTLEEAERAACRDYGLNVVFLKSITGNYSVSSCWKKQWLGRYKDVYDIVPVIREESN